MYVWVNSVISHLGKRYCPQSDISVSIYHMLDLKEEKEKEEGILVLLKDKQHPGRPSGSNSHMFNTSNELT